MTNIINDLIDYIDTLDSFASVKADQLTDDSESICVRAESGTANESRDLTGSRYGEFQFAIYAKSIDKDKCITQLTYYQTSLDLTDFNLIGRTNITCEPLTEPHFISKSDNDEAIYTLSFRLEYYQGV